MMTKTKMHLLSANYRALRLLVVSLLFIHSALGQSMQQHSLVAPATGRRALYLDHARKSIATLNQTWLAHTPISATWAGINAWQRFVIADSLMEYTKLSGDRASIPDIELAVANKDGLDGNDDDLWAVISSVNLYELNGSLPLLQFAQSKYRELTDEYWDNTCGGGIWWDHARTYKNAITNELLLYAATLLYKATGDRTYCNWAFKEWSWFSRSGLTNNRSLINDGLDKHCFNNGQNTYTYNQGVILGALTNLYLIDRDPSHIAMATKIAIAAISDLSNHDGILVEPVEDLTQDGQIFKGIFVYHLGHLFPHIESAADRRIILAFIAYDANVAWQLRKVPEIKINAYWDSGHFFYGAAAQSSGVDLFDAAAAAMP